MTQGLIVNRKLLSLISLCGTAVYGEDDMNTCESAFLYLSAKLLEGAKPFDEAIKALCLSSETCAVKFMNNLIDVGVLAENEGEFVSISPEFMSGAV